jgi:hypothetical protein
MTWRALKTLYFATVCLPPPLFLVLYPMVFLYRWPVPSWCFTAIAIYFWFGAIVVLIDLWFSRRQQDTKILWTALLVILGIVTFPIYWFRYVLPRERV